MLHVFYDFVSESVLIYAVLLLFFSLRMLVSVCVEVYHRKGCQFWIAGGNNCASITSS